MNDAIVSQSARVNKTAVNLYSTICGMLVAAYVLQFLKGETPAVIFFALMVTLLVPLIASWVIRLRDAESKILKHVICLGYALFYIVCIFAVDEQQAYTYAIPMMLLVTVYNDLRFTRVTDIGVAIIAVVHAILFGVKNGFTPEITARVEIEIAVMVIFSLFSIVISKVIYDMNMENTKAIEEGAEKTNNMLSRIVKVSASLVEDVSAVNSKMMDLAAASQETLASMNEVQQGTSDSANSIQNQLYKTEEIQNQIEKVTNASSNIGDNVGITVDAVREGRGYVEKLMEQSRISDTEGTKAVAEVAELQESTSKMTQIVELIKNVASQTSLLALNASIEAARAGEAGRGFSVVATEISNLAGQTQTATGNISELIEGISTEMEGVVVAINSLVESNKIQNESAGITAESFEKIAESIRQIRSSSEELTNIVGSLARANQEIVEGVQTVSAITEEVTAHASTTFAATEHNQEVVQSVQEIVDRMNDSANELKAVE